MKKVIIFISLLLLQLAAAAQGTPQERYIQKWAPTAVREMYRSGVPASITLAQGILESRYGLSSLATEGNNHFGIKCHKDWKGKSMRYDDDAKGECFRVYDSAEESFQDHSDFLRYRDRYKFLFDLKTTDYKGWAYGLKKAGYATDPNYPAKLIKYIEDYRLYEYDTMTTEDSERLAKTRQQGCRLVRRFEDLLGREAVVGQRGEGPQGCAEEPQGQEEAPEGRACSGCDTGLASVVGGA